MRFESSNHSAFAPLLTEYFCATSIPHVDVPHYSEIKLQLDPKPEGSLYSAKVPAVSKAAFASGIHCGGCKNAQRAVLTSSVHGCQMAIARFLDRMCLALRASGLWLRYATLQNLIPSFPWIAPPRPPPWRNPRKGRDQILPSGNLGVGTTGTRSAPSTSSSCPHSPC